MSAYSKLQKLLIDAGLTEIESKIYIELLKKPAKSKWDIVTRTHLSKSSVYRAFEKLYHLKMIETADCIKATSLKNFLGQLDKRERKIAKTAAKIREVTPYLSLPEEAIDELEIIYDKEDLLEKYHYMSQPRYENCLDLGDFESFTNVLENMDHAHTFRKERVRKAKNFCVLSSFGPNTSLMTDKDYCDKYGSNIKFINLNYDGNFMIFSDTDDAMLFNNCSDPVQPISVFIRSKVIADMQRAHFRAVSQLPGK